MNAEPRMSEALNPDTAYEVERDRHGVMFSGPLEVGECIRVVPIAWCEATHAADYEYVIETAAELATLRESLAAANRTIEWLGEQNDRFRRELGLPVEGGPS